MKIIKEEMKKIFHPIVILILVAFTSAFTFSFIMGADGSELTTITTMHVPSDWVKTSRDIINIAGSTLEDEEVEPVYDTLSKRYLKEINDAIGNNERFKAANIYDYDDYKKLYEKIIYSDVTPDMIEEEEVETGEPFSLDGYPPYDPNVDYTLTPEEKYIWDENFFGSMIGSIDQKLEYLEGLHMDDGKYNLLTGSINNYKSSVKFWLNDTSTTSFEKKVLSEISASESYRVINPGPIIESVPKSMRMLILMIIITICFLFGPFIMRDRMNGVIYIQYSSQKGRKILNYQLWTMLISTFIIVTIEVVIVAAVFISNGWGTFWDFKLNSFLNFNLFAYFPGTLGEYFIVLVCMIYFIAFACTLIVFVLSKVTKNYISMLLVIIPWGALCCFIAMLTFSSAFCIHGADDDGNPLYSLTKIPYVELIVCALLFIFSMIIIAIVLRRNKVIDVL